MNAMPGQHTLGSYKEEGLTQVLRGATRLFEEARLHFSQMKVADDYFGILQTVIIQQVLQLEGEKVKQIKVSEGPKNYNLSEFTAAPAFLGPSTL